jgi:formate dehydrogenase iron-sulfur subunit
MADKSFFVDTSKCTACRGCQVACKQWNKLGTEDTVNWGSHQNPPDLSSTCYKVVRFNEAEVAGRPVWLFFPDQCRHCVEPPCKEAADAQVKDAIVKDEATGAVIYTDKTKNLRAKDILDACPYNIPRADKKSKLLVKCTMCFDRVKNGMLPACVKTCPTGAMSFGDRNEVVDKAQKRLAEVKKKFPQASLLDPEDLRVIYLVLEDRKLYHKFAAAEGREISRQAALRKLFKPFTTVAAATAVFAGIDQGHHR